MSTSTARCAATSPARCAATSPRCSVRKSRNTPVRSEYRGQLNTEPYLVKLSLNPDTTEITDTIDKTRPEILTIKVQETSMPAETFIRSFKKFWMRLKLSRYLQVLFTKVCYQCQCTTSTHVSPSEQGGWQPTCKWSFGSLVVWAADRAVGGELSRLQAGILAAGGKVVGPVRWLVGWLISETLGSDYWRPPAGQGRPACPAAGLRTRGDGAVELAGNRNRSGRVSTCRYQARHREYITSRQKPNVWKQIFF